MGWNHVLYFFIFVLCSLTCYLDSFLYQVDYRREVILRCILTTWVAHKAGKVWMDEWTGTTCFNLLESTSFSFIPSTNAHNIQHENMKEKKLSLVYTKVSRIPREEDKTRKRKVSEKGSEEWNE